MKRKFTPRQLQIIANYLQMPFVELVRYYNIGILNTPRLYSKFAEEYDAVA